MTLDLRPARGGFLRPFGCGWFIREFLLGKGPEGSRAIDPEQGAPQADINFEYKEALARATARERSERIISRMVVSGADVTEEDAERIYERELKRVSRKFTHMRYQSFLMYFGVLSPNLPLTAKNRSWEGVATSVYGHYIFHTLNRFALRGFAGNPSAR